MHIFAKIDTSSWYWCSVYRVETYTDKANQPVIRVLRVQRMRNIRCWNSIAGAAKRVRVRQSQTPENCRSNQKIPCGGVCLKRIMKWSSFRLQHEKGTVNNFVPVSSVVESDRRSVEIIKHSQRMRPRHCKPRLYAKKSGKNRRKNLIKIRVWQPSDLFNKKKII